MNISKCGKRLVNDEYWPIVHPVAEPDNWQVRGMKPFPKNFQIHIEFKFIAKY